MDAALETAAGPSSKRPRTDSLSFSWRGRCLYLVEKPPEVLQCSCPICLSAIVENPQQVTCCGYSFCEACIRKVRLDEKPCPTCMTEDYGAFPDKRLQRSLNQLIVHCPNDCKWTGELGNVERHLNESPTNTSNRLHGCQYVAVDCLYCNIPFQRHAVQHHQGNECSQRPYTCDYCREYKATFDDVKRNHYPVCKCYQLPCPNKCDHMIERQNLEQHLMVECPFLKCDFHYAGCEVTLLRKDMPAHLAESLVAHMCLLADYSKKALEEKEKEILQLQQEVQVLKNTVDLHSHLQTPPVTFTVVNFEQHKQNKDFWCSSPFYSHPHGYKLYVKVSFSVNSLLITISLTRGEFDDLLQWPFQAMVYIRILNQISDENHITLTVDFSCGPQKHTRTDQILYDELTGHGESCRYIRDDSILLKIAKVTDTLQLQREIVATVDHRSVRTPPCQFIMRDFQQHKKDGDRWCSPPFFTHHKGYRMDLFILANGYRGGRGTHVSIFTHFMRGEFDSDLKWPFQGDITIQLRNQLEDSEHHSVTIHYNDEVDRRYAAQVMVGERGYGLGHPEFISHTELGLNPAKNCQYLKDDCLMICITQVALC